jgi:hypothetical protein
MKIESLDGLIKLIEQKGIIAVSEAEAGPYAQLKSIEPDKLSTYIEQYKDSKNYRIRIKGTATLPAGKTIQEVKFMRAGGSTCFTFEGKKIYDVKPMEFIIECFRNEDVPVFKGINITVFASEKIAEDYISQIIGL